MKKIILNIQLFADPEPTKDLSVEEKLAQALVELDIEKQKSVSLEKEKKELEEKNKKIESANDRLIKRITEKEDKEPKETEPKYNTNVKITDYYDFKSGKLVMKEN